MEFAENFLVKGKGLNRNMAGGVSVRGGGLWTAEKEGRGFFWRSCGKNNFMEIEDSFFIK